MKGNGNRTDAQAAAVNIERELRIAAAVAQLESDQLLIDLCWRPLHALAVIMQLQLALRHPHHPDEAKQLGRKLCDELIARLALTMPALGRDLADCYAADVSVPLVGEVLLEEEWKVQPGAPSHQVPASKADGLLDLDAWSKHEGCGNVGGPRCPRCSLLLDIRQCDRNGRGLCNGCAFAFYWTAGPTPAGYAFTTWQEAPWASKEVGNE